MVVDENRVNIEYQTQHVDDESQLQADEVNRGSEPGEILKILNRDAESGEITKIRKKEIIEETIMQNSVSYGEDTITNSTEKNNGPHVFDPGGRDTDETIK